MGLSTHARTNGVGCSDGMAQAAGPGTGDSYVGGPGIKAIGMAASPGAGYPGTSNFGTGGRGPGDSGKRCLGQTPPEPVCRLLEVPFTFVFLVFPFFFSNLSAPCPEVTVSCSLLSSLCGKQVLQFVFGGRLLLRGGIHVLGREFGKIPSRRAKLSLNL